MGSLVGLEASKISALHSRKLRGGTRRTDKDQEIGRNGVRKIDLSVPTPRAVNVTFPGNVFSDVIKFGRGPAGEGQPDTGLGSLEGKDQKGRPCGLVGGDWRGCEDFWETPETGGETWGEFSPRHFPRGRTTILNVCLPD